MPPVMDTGIILMPFKAHFFVGQNILNRIIERESGLGLRDEEKEEGEFEPIEEVIESFEEETDS